MTMAEQSLHTRPSLLIRICDDHDSEAWSYFVEAYAPLVHRYLRRQGMQEADALDVVQDVLVSVASDVRKFKHQSDRRGSFRGWLFTIVRNRTADYWRRERRHPRGSGESHVQQVLANVPNEDASENEWNRQYAQDLFRAAAAQVQSDFQEHTWSAFWRTTVEQETTQTVATELGMTVPAIYVARRRVLQRIRQQIEYLQGETK